MVILRAKTIKDVNAYNVIPGYKDWCKKRDDCLYKTKDRKYHGWINLDHLSQKDKEAQCGWHSGNCNTNTYYGIAGYRNICPIAGMNGDYVQPAKLQFSNFGFKANDITESAKIKRVKVYLEHRMVGANVGTGSVTSNWGPTFKGDWSCKIYFTNNNQTVGHVETYTENPRLSTEKVYYVTYSFYDLTIEQLLHNNFALNIEYNHNFNTNPGIIYLKNVYLDIDFENAEMFIEGENDTNTLYTSADNNCCSSITQTIRAGYKNSNGIIPINKAPQALGDKIICIEKPDNVIVEEQQVNDSQKVFQIYDYSNIEGQKSITYQINVNGVPKHIATINYNAIKRNRPSYEIVREYKSQEDFDPKKAYIVVKNGCASYITVYIDSINDNPLILDVSNQDSSNNLLNQNAIRTFHDRIKSLSCGYHTLYIKRGNEDISDVLNNKVIIKISPMNFKFYIYTEETNGQLLHFTQSKSNRNSTILIKRVDNEPQAIIPSINIFDETRPFAGNIIKENIAKNQIIEHTIDKFYAGEYYITVTDNNICSNGETKAKITIDGSHKQNYDYLFVRGEDGTAFDYDYLVAWEGDDLKEPLNIESIDFSQSINDIRICCSPAQTGLSQIGLMELRIKNKSENTIKGIEIELNTLIRNEDNELEVTTNEWTDSDGIFNQFYNLFYEYNHIVNQNIQILNLTPDNDLVDEENVYIKINEIDSMDVIVLYLPFRSVVEKTVYLQYLLCELPMKINSIENCNSLTDEDTEMVEINVYDSMLTQLDIDGDLDLLTLDDSYDCPMECYTTKENGITYTITNIDTNDFENQTSRTKIINDNILQPYGYTVDDQYYDLIDENGNYINVQENRIMRDSEGNPLYQIQLDNQGNPVFDGNGDIQYDYNNPIYEQNKVQWVHEEELINSPMPSQNIICGVNFFNDKETIYVVKTDKNGIANFFIPIPKGVNKKYTVNDLLNEVLYFKFKEQIEYNESVLTNLDITQSDPDPNKKNTVLDCFENYKRYGPNDIAHIKIQLSTSTIILKNYLIFNAELHNTGDSDSVTIFYKICNIKNNEGIFKTTFQTDDKKLIPNKITKNIYCGIDTDISIDSKIEKKVVESMDINVIYLNVSNQAKENKEVKVQIDLGKIPPEYIGNYEFLDISIENGDYSIINGNEENEEENENTYISWLIGEMDSFESQQAIIKIKAKDIGHSDIKIKVFDYLHNEENETVELKGQECSKCEEDNKWIYANSVWKAFEENNETVFYKLFPDGTYKRPTEVFIENGQYKRKWVDKQ